MLGRHMAFVRPTGRTCSLGPVKNLLTQIWEKSLFPRAFFFSYSVKRKHRKRKEERGRKGKKEQLILRGFPAN